MKNVKDEEQAVIDQNKKVKGYIEAHIVLKNEKTVSAKGVMASDDTHIVFVFGEHIHQFKKDAIAVIVRDLPEDETVEKSGELLGYQISSVSGAGLAFNGYRVADDVFLTDKDDYVVFYEDIASIHSGPVKVKEQPQETKEQEEPAVMNEDLTPEEMKDDK